MEGESVEPWLVPALKEDVGEEVDGERSSVSPSNREMDFPLVWEREQ